MEERIPCFRGNGLRKRSIHWLSIFRMMQNWNLNRKSSHRATARSQWYGTTLVFNRAGGLEWKIIHNPDGTKREVDVREVEIPEKTFEHADGSWTHVRELLAAVQGENVLMCPTPALHGVLYPTRSASSVETTYDARGWPLQSIFYDKARSVRTRVDYKTDDRGNITEAIQRCMVPVGPPAVQEVLRPGAIESRVTFDYDESGRAVKKVSYLFGDILKSREVFTYNEHGDRVTDVTEHGNLGPGCGKISKCEIEYEYDSFNNWTHKVTKGDSGTHEARRSLSYYEVTE